MSEKKETIKNRSYLLWLICIVCMILAAAVITYVFTNLKQENTKLYEELEVQKENTQELLVALDELKDIANTAGGDGDRRSISIYISTPRDRALQQASTLNEAMTILETQYANSNNSLQNMLTLLAIVLTAITVIVPIFNYMFLQKETVENFSHKVRRMIDKGKEEIKQITKNAKNEIEVTKQVTDSITFEGTDAPFKTIDVKFEDHKSRARVYWLNGVLARKNKKYKKSIDYFTKAIDADGEDSRQYNSRGWTYLYQPNPQYQLAIDDFNKAIYYDKKFNYPYKHLAVAYTMKSKPDYDKALKNVKIAIYREKKYAGAHYICSVIYISRPNPDYEEALVQINKALEIDEEYSEAYYTRSRIYKERPNPDMEKSKADYDKAIGLGYIDENK